MQTISYGYDFGWLVNIRHDEKKVSQGFMNVIQSMGRCACGSDFTFVGIPELKRRTGLHERTIERHLSLARQLSLIAYAFNEELQRWGYYFLEHPVIVAWRERKKANKARRKGSESRTRNISATVDDLSTTGSCSCQGDTYPDSRTECVNAGACRTHHNHPRKDSEIGQTSSAASDSDCEAPVRLDRQIIGHLPVASIIGRGCEIPPPSPLQGEAERRAQNYEQEHTTEDPSSAENQKCKTSHLHTTNGQNESDQPDGGYPRCDGRGKRDIPRCSDDIRITSAWIGARNALYQRNPALKLWLEPITAMSTAEGLCLDCDDRFLAAHIRQHFGSFIGDALKGAGISQFFISSGERQHALQREAEQARQQVRANQDAYLNNLSPQQQFAVLVQAYPRKSVYGEHFARKTFDRLLKRGELPEITILLQLLTTHKTSADWNRDGGRWIPGLNKWLRAKPWDDKWSDHTDSIKSNL